MTRWVVGVLMFAWMGLLITLTVVALASIVHTIFHHERIMRRQHHTPTSRLNRRRAQASIGNDPEGYLNLILIARVSGQLKSPIGEEAATFRTICSRMRLRRTTVTEEEVEHD